jgi:hypothetical protein
MRLWRRVLARAGAVSIRHYFPSSTAQSLSVADSNEAHQYVRKTCLERFPHATSFRHDLPCIFLASGKPFQPLLAACRKTSVSVTPTAASPDRREAEPFVFHMIEAVGFFLYPLMRTRRAFH